jgi:Spy/CpxP family protein refolding chaperone
MKKTLILALAILALSLALFAQPMEKSAMKESCPDCKQNMNMEQPQGAPMQDMMKQLDLTKEQQKKLDVLRDEQEKFMNTKKAELENLQIDKQNAMQAEDYTKAKQINKSISDLQLVIDNAMVDHRAAMLKELTPEQKEKMKQMMPMGKGKMGPNMMKDKPMMKGKHKGME